MLIVLAKLGSRESVGIFGLSLAVTSPIMLFANLQLRAFQVTDTTQQYQFGDYLAVRLSTTLLALLVIAGIAFSGSYSRDVTAVILATGVAKSLESLGDVIHGLLQQRERMDRVAQLQIVTGILSLLALGVAVALTRSVLVGTLAIAAVCGLRVVVCDIPSALWVLGTSGWRSVLPHWKIAPLARLTGLTLPLGIAAMVISLHDNVPRYLIQHYFGTTELGIFVAITSLTRAVYIVLAALEQSMMPRLAACYAAGNVVAFRRLLLRLVAAGASLCLAATLASLIAGKQILTFAYTSEYADHQSLFAWMMLATTIALLAHLHPVLIVMRAFKTFLAAWIFSLLLQTLLAAALIPRHGLMGAALAMLVANAVRLLVVVTSVSYLVLRNFPSSPQPNPRRCCA